MCCVVAAAKGYESCVIFPFSLVDLLTQPPPPPARRLASDPLLHGVSHVVVDEVHERTLQGDVLMALLRRIAAARNAAAVGAAAAASADDNNDSNNTCTLSATQPPAGGCRPPPPRLKVLLMSATLDAAAYSEYFWGCPVLSCPGRSFPVDVQYLEDVYQATGYLLAPDSRAALRGSGNSASAAARRGMCVRGAGGRNASLIAAGWGDDEGAATATGGGGGGPGGGSSSAGGGGGSAQGSGACLNPHFDPELYSEYRANVRRSLSRLNEDVLDLDLVEELIGHVDAVTPHPGALLVFLPGLGEIAALHSRMSGSARFGRGRHLLLPLHSAISSEQQRAAFCRPPGGSVSCASATLCCT